MESVEHFSLLHMCSSSSSSSYPCFLSFSVNDLQEGEEDPPNLTLSSLRHMAMNTITKLHHEIALFLFNTFAVYKQTYCPFIGGK